MNVNLFLYAKSSYLHNLAKLVNTTAEPSKALDLLNAA